MRPVLRRPSPVARRLLPLALLAALAGCQKEEDVRHYTAPKPESPPPPADVAAPDRPKQRLLGAIVPHGDELWVFKVMGPEAAVKGHEGEFESFVDSVTFKDNAKSPDFKVPAGWKPSKGTQFSVAAFRLGDDDKAPELTVTPSRGSVSENVNRWRGQVGLPPAGPDELKQTTKEKKVGGETAVLVDLTGHGAGGMAGRAPFAGKAHPPIPPARAARPRLTYTTPEGWREGNQTQFSLAAFRTGEGRDAADVTATALAGPAGGLLGNVNRWRDQLGLARWDEGQLAKESSTLDVAGSPATYVDLSGGAGGKRIVGAVLPRGGQTWFFKLTGPADEVGRQKPAFEAFVKSVRFQGDAND